MPGYLTPSASRGRLVAWRAPAPLALPAPAGHVPQTLPELWRPRRRSLLPLVWTSLGTAIIGFVVAGTLISTDSAGTGGVVGRLNLADDGAAPPTEGRLRGLGEALARLVLTPPPAPVAIPLTLPPDVRAPVETASSDMIADDTVTSLGALADTLNTPALDVGPLGEALPTDGAPTATWSGLIVGATAAPTDNDALPAKQAMGLAPSATITATAATADDEDDEPTPALLGAPRPPPAAPSLRRPATAPRLPRITQIQPSAGGHSATPGASVSIPLPPLPEPRQVAVMRPVPPPDGYITQTTAAPAARQAGSANWMKFARAFDPNDGRPRIALVVTDLGLAAALTDQAINYLPGPVTLAFNPFAENLPRLIEQARKAGHEVLINLPLEASGTQPRDAGSSPAPAVTPLLADESLGRLDWALARATGYVGVASFMGAGVNGSDDALRPVLTALRDRGFIYVDRQTGPRAAAQRLASELGVPRAVADRQLDAEPTREAIEARLAEIERQARDTGFAVALVRPHGVSFERLAIWQTTLDAKGIALAPITAVLNRQRNR